MERVIQKALTEVIVLKVLNISADSLFRKCARSVLCEHSKAKKIDIQRMRHVVRGARSSPRAHAEMGSSIGNGRNLTALYNKEVAQADHYLVLPSYESRPEATSWLCLQSISSLKALASLPGRFKAGSIQLESGVMPITPIDP